MNSTQSFVLGVLSSLVASFIYSILGYVIKEAIFPRQKRIAVIGEQNQLNGYDKGEMSSIQFITAVAVCIICGTIVLFMSYQIGMELDNSTIWGIVLGLIMGSVISIVMAVAIFRLWDLVSNFLMIGVIILGFFLIISFFVQFFLSKLLNMSISYQASFLGTVFVIGYVIIAYKVTHK